MGRPRGRNHEVRPGMHELVQRRPAQEGTAIRQVDARPQPPRAVNLQARAADGVCHAIVLAVVRVVLIVVLRGKVRDEDDPVEVVQVVLVEPAGQRVEVEVGGPQRLGNAHHDQVVFELLEVAVGRGRPTGVDWRIPTNLAVYPVVESRAASRQAGVLPKLGRCGHSERIRMGPVPMNGGGGDLRAGGQRQDHDDRQGRGRPAEARARGPVRRLRTGVRHQRGRHDRGSAQPVLHSPVARQSACPGGKGSSSDS